ncbi:MAG: hypothetical protein ACTSPI_04210 [Candidatus Heimdallarchaeaceae archaeon]
MGQTMQYFTDWLNVNVTYYKFRSSDGAGKVTYEDGVTLSCYIEGKRTLVKVDNVNEVISTERLYLDGENSYVPNITTKDKFVVNGRNRPVLSIQSYYDEEGNLDYMVVFL